MAPQKNENKNKNHYRTQLINHLKNIKNIDCYQTWQLIIAIDPVHMMWVVIVGGKSSFSPYTCLVIHRVG